ncbi:MAG: AtpZ/AtpI family protein [Myxococcota bacterium]
MGRDPAAAQAARSAAAVTQLAVSTVVGGFLGQWGDTQLNTAPVFLALGFVLGFIIGLVNLFRILPSGDSDGDSEDDPQT